MLVTLAVFFALAAGSAQPAADSSPAHDVERELLERDSGGLWPGFEPRSVPLAVYDGRYTLLFRHPGPPPEFSRASSEPSGFWWREGRHPGVTANSSIDLGGVLTATLLLEGAAASREPVQLASVAVHESFHVFQRNRHPGWQANEMSVFEYPFEDAEQLQVRVLETLALRRALEADPGDGQNNWAGCALRLRKKRFELLPEGTVAYERLSELNEGLANYVQHLFLEAPPPSLSEAFAADAVRDRAYQAGRALAILLDEVEPRWKGMLTELDDPSLDRLLAVSLRGKELGTCKLDVPDIERAEQTARRRVAELRQRRARLLKEFRGRPGWRILVTSGQPLWPEAFDPQNITQVEGGLLHTRMLRLGNAEGRIEVLNRQALTRGLGAHPLFQGVGELELNGFESEPQVVADGETVLISAAGVRGEFRGVEVSKEDGVIRVRLP